MPPSITLRPAQRKALLHHYRRGTDPAVRLRAHILLLLDDGRDWDTIAALLFTSTATINRWRQRFLTDGVAGVLGRPRGRRPRLGDWWASLIVAWVTLRTPPDFGFLRSRWTCAAVAVVLKEDHGLRLSAETVRRRLRAADLVWRRPRPVLRRQDPQRAAKLRALRRLLAELPADEVAVFEDEVDVSTNPKIGAMWMRRGEQAEVETPGDQEKRYLAGSLNWRTGELIATEGEARDAELFVRHLDELRRRLRRYRVIHVICDNASFHDRERCRKVKAYLERWGHRIKIHYLPTRSPETNPIERVWWHLHDEITRNHRCRDIEELLDLVFEWLEGANRSDIPTSEYPRPQYW